MARPFPLKGRVLALAAAVLLMSMAVAALAFRRHLTALAIDWAMERYVGVSTRVTLRSLGTHAARADLTFPRWGVTLPGVEFRWRFHRWYPPRLEVEAALAGESLEASSVAASGGFRALLKADFETATLHRADVELEAGTLLVAAAPVTGFRGTLAYEPREFHLKLGGLWRQKPAKLWLHGVPPPEHPLVPDRGHFHFDGLGLALEGVLEIREGGRRLGVRLPGLVGLGPLEAEVALGAGGRLAGTASAAHGPFSARMEFSGDPDRVTLRGTVADAARTWVDFKGEWTPVRGARIAFDEEYDFFEGGFAPGPLHPALEGFKSRLGRLGVKGELRWDPKGRLTTRGRVQARHLSFDLDGVPVDGVEGTLPFTSLWPPRLDGSPTVTVSRIGRAVPFRNTRVTLALGPKGIAVSALESEWGEGKVRAEPFTAEAGTFAFATTVTLEGVNVDSLLRGAEVTQVKAKGIVGGRVPLEYRNGYLHIRDGRLSDTGGEGWIQYKDPSLADFVEPVKYMDQFQALMNRGQQALAFKALDNFFFRKLEMKLNREPAKGLEALLTLAGHNPDLINGQPFQFNIALTGHLENAVKQSFLRGMMQPEEFTRDFTHRK